MKITDDKVQFKPFTAVGPSKPTPGIAYVEPVTIEASYETREVPLKAGKNWVYKGLLPVGTTITCTLYDDQDLADCQDFVQYVRSSIDNTKKVTTWKVDHPSLGGLTEYVIKSITYPRPQKSGSYIFVVKIEEYRPPEVSTPQKVGSDGKIDQYSAITATGEAEAGSTTEDLASAERTARLQAADRELELKLRQDANMGWLP